MANETRKVIYSGDFNITTNFGIRILFTSTGVKVIPQGFKWITKRTPQPRRKLRDKTKTGKKGAV